MEGRFHKLTELIAKEIGQDRLTWELRDKIIREYLEECVSIFGISACPPATARQILGLEPEKKEEGKVGEKVWCEHTTPTPGEAKKQGPFSFPKTSIQVSDHWNFCPECSAPRPKEMGLREKLAKIMYETYYKDQELKWEDDGIEHQDYLELSDVAIRTIKENE